MALPQDGQDANGLEKVTEIPAGKELMFIDPTTNEGGIITLENLTKQILNGLTTQAFKMDTGTQTIPAAINYLFGKTSSITLKDDISTNSFARCIVFGRLCLVYMALYPKEAFNDGDVLVDLSVSAKEMTFAAINSGLADSYIQVSGNQIYYKGTQNSSRIRGEILFLINQ